MRKQIRGAALVLAIVLGLFFGMGLYTFTYGRGFSYLSSDPKACINCHIMQDEYDSWQKGTHHTAARCVDCHLPQSFVPKYIAKADEGWRHSKAFTLQDFHEPIRITPHDSLILQDNCVRCHGDFVHAILVGGTTAEDLVKCVHCHQGVGHGARQ